MPKCQSLLVTAIFRLYRLPKIFKKMFKRFKLNLATLFHFPDGFDLVWGCAKVDFFGHSSLL